jgi:O-acetyl-ADP-ribose deacetylase (regulator of RNase III)
MKVIQQSDLGHVKFSLAAGDIFDAKVDAIVSSEQTDFVLSGNPESLSGQIWKRYGAVVQRELDAATKGEVLDPGMVIDTSGGQDFKRIFHAGFHDPNDWPEMPGGHLGTNWLVDTDRDFRETGYFAAIGSCITQILNTAVAQKIRSIVFPLIGCGVFGLDEKMLILQFLNAIEQFNDELIDCEQQLDVWLVIRDRTQFESVTGTFLDLLIHARKRLVLVCLKRSGVPILDRFAARLAERTNEEWAKWQLCRYAEIAVEFMCYGICRATCPAIALESLFEEGRAPTFGVVREVATRLAASSLIDPKAWGARFFASVFQDVISTRALEAINAQRNDLAHGRQSLSLATARRS